MIWDFILYHLPVWLQIGLIAIPVIAVFWFCIITFGWMRVRGWIAPAVGLIAALGLLSRARQQGYADRQVQEKAAEDKAVKTVETERGEAAAMDDKALNTEVDKWSRP